MFGAYGLDRQKTQQIPAVTPGFPTKPVARNSNMTKLTGPRD